MQRMLKKICIGVFFSAFLLNLNDAMAVDIEIDYRDLCRNTQRKLRLTDHFLYKHVLCNNDDAHLTQIGCCLSSGSILSPEWPIMSSDPVQTFIYSAWETFKDAKAAIQLLAWTEKRKYASTPERLYVSFNAAVDAPKCWRVRATIANGVVEISRISKFAPGRTEMVLQWNDKDKCYDLVTAWPSSA